MPAALTYPGVYIEEIPSGVRTIVSVPTSVTAFVGRTSKGPVAEATDITSWPDFERKFGGLWQNSQLSFCGTGFLSEWRFPSSNRASLSTHIWKRR